MSAANVPLGDAKPAEPKPAMTADVLQLVSRGGVGDKKKDKQKKKVKKIRTLMERLVEELSDTAKTLEKWDSSIDRVAERRTNLKDDIKKYTKNLKKLHDTIPQSAVQHWNLPLDLIRNIDAYKSPNPWMHDLYSKAKEQNDIARGELMAIGSFQTTLKYFLEHNSLPDEPLPPAPLPDRGGQQQSPSANDSGITFQKTDASASSAST